MTMDMFTLLQHMVSIQNKMEAPRTTPSGPRATDASSRSPTLKKTCIPRENYCRMHIKYATKVGHVAPIFQGTNKKRLLPTIW